MRWLLVGLIILFYSVKVQAIEAVVSHTVFYISDPTHAGKLIPNVETYWQINPRTLHYSSSPEKTISAKVMVAIVVMTDTGILKEDHYILQTTPRTTLRELAENKIIDLRRYQVVPGNIRIKFSLTDLAENKNTFVSIDSFDVVAPGNTPFYSGVQLLDTIFASPEQTAFKKNGRQQVPMCTNFLDDHRNTLHYYAELYQSDKVPATDYPLTQKVYISKKEDGDFYGNYLKKDTIRASSTSLASGSFNIASLESGNYYLHATLENKVHQILTSQVLFFQRLNSHPVAEKDTIKKNEPVSDTGMEHVTLLDLNKTFIAKYTFSEICVILKMLLPVSDPLGTATIKGFLKKPEELYMRYYIYNYFLAINKDDPKTAWKEYSNKIIEVKRRFSEHGTPGYETDRGAVFLRYGSPTDIITVENESGTLPYEIWQYNTLTQKNRKDIADAVFLFYKPNQSAFEYRLLHSTVDGEAQNPAWRTYLYTSSEAGSNGNSRAEQYIGNR